MNKPKLSITSIARVLLNFCTVVALVLVASLVGIGGAALWIYSRPEMTVSASKSASPRLKSGVLTAEDRVFPKLTPVQTDDETPAQLIPAHYVPSESEIATFSGSPRYTYVSYNGGRQRLRLCVKTVTAETVPASLPVEELGLARTDDRPSLSDPSSRYITNAQGRVVGVDGTASATQTTSARALPVQPVGLEPEVRVASPVIARKALPVDDGTMIPATTSFDVRAELAREDDQPVLRAQHVARGVGNIRPTVFGASDDSRPFGQN